MGHIVNRNTVYRYERSKPLLDREIIAYESDARYSNVYAMLEVEDLRNGNISLKELYSIIEMSEQSFVDLLNIPPAHRQHLKTNLEGQVRKYHEDSGHKNDFFTREDVFSTETTVDVYGFKHSGHGVHDNYSVNIHL